MTEQEGGLNLEKRPRLGSTVGNTRRVRGYIALAGLGVARRPEIGTSGDLSPPLHSRDRRTTGILIFLTPGHETQTQ